MQLWLELVVVCCFSCSAELARASKEDAAAKMSQCRAEAQRGAHRSAMDVCKEAADLLDSGSDRAEMLVARAAALRALSRTPNALQAYQEAINADSGNQAAILGRAEVALRLGDLSSVSGSVSMLSDKAKARELAERAERFKKDLERARAMVAKEKHIEANRLFDSLSLTAPESSMLLLEYADSLIAEGQMQRAVDVLKKEAGLFGADSSKSLMTMAQVLLTMGNLEAARKTVLATIRDDPELKPARALKKRIDELVREIKAALDAPLLKLSVEALEAVRDKVGAPLSPDDPCYDARFPKLFRSAFLGTVSASLCIKYGRLGQGSKGVEACTAARDLVPPAAMPEGIGKADLGVALVESLLAERRFEEALKEAKALAEAHRGDDSIHKLVRKCADELRKSKLVDYYAVLGLKKGEVTSAMVKKAYKRMSVKWHPDKHRDNPKRAEEKMREINRAYAILGDEQKRQIYDQTGADPDDQEAQAQAQGAHGGFGSGMHFGGAGFGGFPGFDFGGMNGGNGGNFEFVFRDAQGRQWRQQGSGGGRQGFEQRQQGQKRRQWQWKDDL